MQLNSFIFIILVSITSNAFAALHQPEGKVWMLGEIVESACTIDSGSLDQVVDMGILPIGVLRSRRESEEREFEINLVECLWGEDTQNNYTNFDISFTGNTQDNYFLVHGDAKGVFLSLADSNRKQIIPGEKINYPGGKPEITNKYFLKLLPNGDEMKPGDFESLIHFNISYN